MDFDFQKAIIIACAVGLVIGLIVVFILKKQLKSVAPKTEASDYTRPGSLRITARSERFLYKTTDRREKPRDNSNHGGGRPGGPHR